jgi:hypothetical protein
MGGALKEEPTMTISRAVKKPYEVMGKFTTPLQEGGRRGKEVVS